MPDTERIPTNLRTLLILEIVGNSDRAMSATEINNELGLPKQTVHRLVTTLEREGFLQREQGSSRFRPSRRSRQMGFGLLFASRTHIVRHQILQDVSNQVRESVNFVVPEDTGMHYIDRVETDWPFRIQLPIGSNVPFHCTASGKAFMASLSKSARIRFVSGLALEKRTSNTIVSPEALLDELALSAKRGFTLDQEEFIEDMSAVAVPVCDDKGRFVAAIATHGPKQRMTADKLESYQVILKTAAKKLSAAIFS